MKHQGQVTVKAACRQDKDALEAELVLLERALAAFDFEHLRGRWPILSGGADRPVFLTDDDDATLACDWTIDKPILFFSTIENTQRTG